MKGNGKINHFGNGPKIGAQEGTSPCNYSPGNQSIRVNYHFHKKYSRRDQINLNSWNKFPEPIPQIIQVPACELLVGESPRSQITIIQSLSGISVPITPFELKYILNFMRRGLQNKFSIWSY